jgi:hypothetical protein
MKLTYIGFILVGLLALLVSLVVTGRLMDGRVVADQDYLLSVQAEQQKKQKEAVDKIEEELKQLLSGYRSGRKKR